jgi:PST family polysaccharide transporter
MMILARLLEPRDFGMLGMVTAFTGVLALFRDFGLSTATVQRATITKEQTSTLFWINILAGAVLTIITLVSAPLVANFYHEPQLFSITAVVSIGFLVNGASVQHSALLQRNMRFTTLAVIDLASLTVSTMAAIVAARAGLGYWSLVVMTLSIPVTIAVGVWLTAGWIPGAPRRGFGIRSMLRFGSTLTLNGLVLHVAFNLDKILLGRFWGADAIGLYGRAYQLSRIPTDSLNSAVGDVAFSALSRIQEDPVRLRHYFLRGYTLVLTFTLPITAACALLADDVVYVMLGPKWKAAAPIFHLLAPTILVFAIANPLGWLLNALGLAGRGLRISLVLAPLMAIAYIVGLPYGPAGVALAYSAAMFLWIVPIIAWAVYGTAISFSDLARVVSRPLVCTVVAAMLALALRAVYAQTLSPLPRLVLDCTIFFSTYFVLLLYVAGQKALFLDLLHTWKKPAPDGHKSLASA